MTAAEPTEISLTSLARGLIRYRWVVVGCAVGCAVVFGALGVVRPRTWTASATFMPQGRRTSAAGLSGVAAQLGISVPTMDAGQGPGFYADFVTSRTMLGAVADTTFEVEPGNGRSRVAPADIYRVRGATPALRRDNVIRTLGARITAIPVLKTGVVRMRVSAPTPGAAYRMAGFILDHLNSFDLVTRQSQARAERIFMEGRLDDSRVELRSAEDSLQDFLQRNRDYKNSPELSFRADRLSRAVQVRQELYTSLAQAYEQAKIEEVRDTPVITIVEQPELPARPDSRGLVLSTLVALLGGAGLGALLAILLVSLDQERAVNPAGMNVIEREFREALGELLHPWRILRRSRRDR
jgi:uncharacterized protein involved in exopolysaccharide biosynthesis